MTSRLKIFFDGSSRPQPDGMTMAVVMRGEAMILPDARSGASTDAEWLALLHAVRLARDLPVERFVLLGDSLAVIGQANGVVKCRGEHRRYLDEFHALTVTGVPRIRWIKRAQNLAGIALERWHGR